MENAAVVTGAVYVVTGAVDVDGEAATLLGVQNRLDIGRRVSRGDGGWIHLDRHE